MPQRVSRVLAVAANTFRETVRQRVLYNLVFFALLMIVSGLLLFDLSLRQDDKIIKDLGLAAMDGFGTLIAIFIGVALMNKEIERRSLYPLLARPLTRDEFLLGKYVGLAFTLLVNLAVMTAGLYATLAMLSARSRHVATVIDADLLMAVVGIYLGLLLTVAVALFFSATTSAAMGAVSTFAVVLVGRYADVIANMGEVLPGVPLWLPRILYVVLPNFHHFDIKNTVVHGGAVGWGDVAWMAAYGLSYSALLLGAAAVVFRRKDL